MDDQSLNRHQETLNPKRTWWIRRIALLLVFALTLTAVLDRVVYVSADLADFVDDADAAAAANLLEKNDYIRQTWLERAGSVTAAALTEPTTFTDYYQLAEMAISKKDFNTALTHVEKSLTLLDPADPEEAADVWLVKGSLETILDNHDEALISLGEAARLNPSLADAYLVQTQILVQQEKWERAVDTLSLYFDVSTSIDTRMYGLMGELLMLLGHFQEAADQYSLSIKYNASNPDIYFKRGACYVQTGAYAEAVADFTRAADLGADRVLCIENIVLIHLINKDYAAVLDAGSVLAEEKIASAELLQNMGVAALALERMEEALIYFDQAITLNSDLASSYYYRGIGRLSLEQFEEAKNDFSISINRNEAVQLSYYNRAVSYLNQNLLDEARTDLELSISTGGDLVLIQSAETILQQLEDATNLVGRTQTAVMPVMYTK